MSSPVTIQPSTKDNYLRASAVTTNMGTDVNIEVYSTGLQRTLLSFDFAASVPAGATITSAILTLYCWSGASGRTITVYRLLRTDWNETQSTWNIYKTGSSWGTVGALNSTDNPDFTTADAATSASSSSAGFRTWTVTAQVQAALDTVAGIAHFLIADVGASAAQQAYYSRHYTTDANKCPMLYIEYTVPSAVTPNFIPFFWA